MAVKIELTALTKELARLARVLVLCFVEVVAAAVEAAGAPGTLEALVVDVVSGVVGVA